MSWKKSLLVIFKLLRLLLNILTFNDKYFLSFRDNFRQPIQLQLSKKQKIFSRFFVRFWNLSSNLNNFKKKINLIADIFPKWRNPKYVVNQMSNKSPFIPPFGKQHVTGTKHCWNPKGTTFTIFLSHCEGNWVGKNLS